MKRQPPPKAAASIALFPFLAVLLCTMGGLIVLLVVIARHARQQASVDVQASIAAHDQLELRRSDLEWRRGQLRVALDQTAGDLADRREEISHLEDHTRRLRDQLADLNREVTDFDRHAAAKAQDAAQMRSDLKELQQQIRATEEEIDQNQRARPKSQSYAIIPYAGPHQTMRRPIYIECTADAIILQPEGIELIDTDFFGPVAAGNPLAAALRAVRQHLASHVENDATGGGEPYPLLLVRPDGMLSYFTAREAMSSWGADFGYEFIDQDWKLEYKPPDAHLAVAMSRAIDDARRRQATLALAAPQLLTSRQRQAYRSQAAGRGAASSGAVPARASDNSLPGQGDSPGYGKGGTSADLAAIYGSGGNRSGVPGGGAVGMSVSGAATGTDGGVPSSAQGPRAGGGSPDGPALAGTPSGAASSPGSGAAGGGSFTPGGTQQGSMQTASMPTLKAGQPSDGVAGSTAQDSSSGTANGPALKGMDTPGKSFASQSRPKQSAAKVDMDAPPTAEEVRTPKRSLAKTRGKDWTLPDDHRAAVAVTRPILVRCYGDQLVLMQEPGDKEPSRIIPLSYRTQDSVDPLVASIRQRIESWGIAGRGMYWRPTLVIDVAADGRARFADLRELLTDSGLELRQRTTIAAPAEIAPRY